jgi:hypothetical protein
MQTRKSRGPRFVVRPSPVHGRGVFANRDIGSSDLISEYKGARAVTIASFYVLKAALR